MYLLKNALPRQTNNLTPLVKVIICGNIFKTLLSYLVDMRRYYVLCSVHVPSRDTPFVKSRTYASICEELPIWMSSHKALALFYLKLPEEVLHALLFVARRLFKQYSYISRGGSSYSLITLRGSDSPDGSHVPQGVSLLYFRSLYIVHVPRGGSMFPISMRRAHVADIL